MQRIIIFLGLLLFGWQQVSAQPGMPHYTSTNKKAIKEYEQAVDAFNAHKDDEALENLESALKHDDKFAECYFMEFEIYNEMGDHETAGQQLAKGMKIAPEIFPNGYFFLGLIAMSKGDYDNAAKNYHAYLSQSHLSEDMEGKAQKDLADCAFAKKAMAHPVPFDPWNLGPNVNTENGEYYPCLTADDQTLLFTRLVPDKYVRGGKQEDFYVSHKVGKSWSKALPVTDVNTEMNEGAPTISADGRLLVFAACEDNGTYGRYRRGFGSCDLFYSVKQGVRWSQAMNLGPTINTANWETQPSLSADGSTLYFIRGKDTHHGIQQQDIYVSHLGADSAWTKAQRLPDGINTPYQEESVFIHPDGKTLYYSSNGLPGMGGLDIYVTHLDSAGNWSTPKNLGYPINTFSDENSLMVDASGKVAYFASNRKGGYGDLDLYGFHLYPGAQPTPVTYAKGKVYDANTHLPLAATFELFDLANGKKVVSSTSDPETGEFLVVLPVDHQYALQANAPGYLFFSANFKLTSQSDTLENYAFDVPMKPIVKGESVVLHNVFFDLDKYDLKPESKTELNRLTAFLQAHPSVKIEVGGHTDNQGDDQYNLKLSQERAQAVVNYLVNKGIDKSRLTAKGYGETKPIADNDTEEGRAKNRRTEFTIE